ncbi:MAG: response regulator [Thermodesulfobacteriota bacterium]|nr:response regulator [Thermodesulfobacteriota bacterium]
MLNIILVSSREKALVPFVEALKSDQDIKLNMFDTGAAVLTQVQHQAPHLVIIDDHLDDQAPLDLVSELLQLNAMINIAMVSTMDDDAFHEATEGLGLLPRLPSPPDAADASPLLTRLRALPGLIS